MRKETVLLLTSTFIALAIAEIFLAAFFPQRTVNQYLRDRPAMFRANDVLFMDLKPGFQGYLKEEEFRTDVAINSLGYRQDEFAADKGEKFRVLVVGDSFTFGYGVEEGDGYVRVMERALNAETGDRQIEAINAGVPAWWTDSYYLYLKTRGVQLNPDVVVLGLFMGNDIDARDARYAIWPEVDERGLPLSTTSERVRIDNGHRVRTKRRTRWVIPVLRNSHLFQLVYSSGKNIGRLFSPKVQAETLYMAEYSDETSEIIARVKNLISGMRDLANGNGARFVVAMIPERQQVYIDEAADAPDLDYDKPQRLFAEFFAEQGIDYVDLLPAVREAAGVSETELYYQRDSHFTQAGYLVAGQTVARHLIESGVIPRP